MSDEATEVIDSMTRKQLAVLEQMYCQPHAWHYGEEPVIAQLKKLGLYQQPGHSNHAVTYRGSRVVRELCRRGEWPPSKHPKTVQ